ncbi:unnamed protein product, partial [Medioppia subpectinata]
SCPPRYNHKCDIFSYGVICCELNWRIPADPDYLCRDDNFLISFDKLPEGQTDTLLARVARLSCQKNASIRPEFSELLEIFESEYVSGQHRRSPDEVDGQRHRYILRRELSLPVTGTQSPPGVDLLPLNGAAGDIFDQHLIRRRNSQIERKYFNGIHR